MSGRVMSWPAPGAAVVALDGPAAVALAELLGPVLRRMADRGDKPTPAEVAAIKAVVTAAREWATGAAIALASDMGTEIDNAATSDGTWSCTTAEASRRLGISQRAVRQACTRGALEARRATARGPWLVAGWSIARFEQKRISRT